MIRKAQLIIAGTLVTATLAFAGQAILGGKRVKPIDTVTKKEISKDEAAKLETIDLGAGCFWCIEAVLERVKGVRSVESGYMGGKLSLIHISEPTRLRRSSDSGFGV